MEKKKENYRSYVLVGRNNEEFIEIDWTKVKGFKDLATKRYKLEQIDFFTSHFPDKASLIEALISAQLLDIDQLKNLRFWIYRATQDKVETVIDGKVKKRKTLNFSSEHLQYGIAYKPYLPFLSSDNSVIQILQQYLDNYDFMTQLHNKYVNEGPFSKRNSDILKQKIAHAEASLRFSAGQEHSYQERILNSYYMQLRYLDEMRGLLKSMQSYAMRSSQGVRHSINETECARNNAEEFFLRIKYGVKRCTHGHNDQAHIIFDYDKNGKIRVKYLDFHNLVMFIGNAIDKISGVKEGEQPIDSPFSNTPHTIVKRKKNDPIDGQMSLFGSEEEDYKTR